VRQVLGYGGVRITNDGTFHNLFRPLKVGPFTLKNRIAVAPHGPMLAENGLLTRQYVDYEIEKAKGGAGLIIMASVFRTRKRRSSALPVSRHWLHLA